MKRFGLFLLIAGSALAQGNAGDSPRLGVALSFGTLGPGIEAATGITKWLNVRGGFNYFSYGVSGTTNSSNLTFDGTLRLASGEVLVDFFPVRWLHLSGGALVWNGFQGTGTVRVPGGQTFTLNDVSYYSSVANPVAGNGKISANEAAPGALFGFGNLLPRNQRHFAATVDLGVAFQGSPTTVLNLTGSTCPTASPIGCATISSQPAVQANVLGEQNKINKDLKPYNFYPIIQASFGYKF